MACENIEVPDTVLFCTSSGATINWVNWYDDEPSDPDLTGAVWIDPNQDSTSIAGLLPFDPSEPVLPGDWVIGYIFNEDTCFADLFLETSPTPNAAFNVPLDGICGDLGIAFDLVALDPTLTYSWDFGDGEISADPQPVHEYFLDGGGTQGVQVTLSATNGEGCSSSSSQTIEVLQVPNPGITTLPPLCQSEVVDIPYQLTSGLFNPPFNPTNGITSVHIDWGNGSDTTITEILPSSQGGYVGTVFEGFGYYVVEFTSYAANGCVSVVSDSLFIGNNPTIGTSNPGNTVGLCSPSTVGFPVSNFEDNPAETEYLLDWGDGTSEWVTHEFLTSPEFPDSVFHTYTESSCGESYSPTSSTSYNNALVFTIEAVNDCYTSSSSAGPITIHGSPNPELSGLSDVCLNTSYSYAATELGINIPIPPLVDCSPSPVEWYVLAQDGQPNVNPSFGFDSTWNLSFPAPGEYDVNFTAMHTVCGDSSGVTTVCAYPELQALGNVSPLTGCAPLLISLEDLTPDPELCGDPTTTWTISGGIVNWIGSELDPQSSAMLMSPGEYTVTLRVGIPNNTCSADEISWTITVFDEPLMDIAADPTACEGEGFVVTDQTNSNPFRPIDTWQWFVDGNPEGTWPGDLTVAGQAAGSVTVSATATNLCGSDTEEVDVVIEPAPDVQFSLSAPIFCAETDVTVVADGGTTYNWANDPSIVGTTVGSTVVINADSDVTLQVTATSANGCSSTDDVTVQYAPLPEATITLPTPPCPDEAVTISGAGASGTPPYASLDWSGDTALMAAAFDWVAPETATPLTVTLTVTDALGCQGVTTATLTSYNRPDVEAGPPLTLCDNSAYPVELEGFSPGLTEGLGTGAWTGTGLTGPTTFTPDGVGVTTLTYTFTDANGCADSDERTITVDSFIQVDPGLPVAACFGDSPFTIPDFSPATAAWTGTGVLADGTLDPNLAPGDYLLTVTNGTESCESIATSTFTVHPLPEPTITAPADICEGDTITFTLSDLPGATVAWSDDPAAPLIRDIVADAVDVTLIGDAESIEGCTNSTSATVLVNLLPVLNLPDQGILCNQDIPTTLTGATPTGGTWSGTGVTDGMAGTFQPDAVGVNDVMLTYTFTDANLCTNNDSLLVTVEDPTLAVAGADFAVCDIDTLIALSGFSPASGGAWSSPDFALAANGTFDTSPLVPAEYTLTYTYGSGTCENSDSRVLTIHERPVVTLTSTATAACVGDIIEFAVSASGGNPPYTFDWMGASPSAGDDTAASMTWNVAGTPTVEVTVTDGNGCSETVPVTITVWPLPTVDAGLDTTFCSQAIPGVLEGFSPGLTDGGTGSWEGFGALAGALGTDGTLIPDLAGPGTYTAMYTYTESVTGCVNQADITIDIQDPVVADAGLDVTACDNAFPLQLNGFPQVDAVWSGATTEATSGLLDDATGLLSPGILSPGTYSFFIQTGVGTCFSEDAVTVTIDPLPVLDIAAPDAFCANLGIVSLTPATPAGGNWFGTGIVDPVIGTFNSSLAPASYAPAYTFEDPLTGCRDTLVHDVTVHPVPMAAFTADALGCSNLDLPIANTSTGQSTNEWDFGGVGNSLAETPAFTFPGDGTYTITLLTGNAFGCLDTASQNVDITHPPVADFTLSPDSGCAPLDVTFTNQSDAPYGTYLWTVNGNDFAQEAPPQLNFAQGDSVVDYAVSLEVTNLCGTSLLEDDIVVTPTPVMGFAFEEDTVCSPFLMNIMNTSVGLPENVVWDFGDGTEYSGAEPPDHWFEVDSVEHIFTVTVTGTNACGTDVATGDVLVVPNQVEAFFTLSTPEGCAPFDVTVEDFSSATTAVSYTFDNGDFAATPSASTTYPNPGTYTITQFVTNGCSFDTLQIPVTVHPVPDVALSVSDPNGCEGAEFAFTSVTDNPGNADWDFGDGNVGGGLTATHAYGTSGTFTVTFSTEAPLTGCTAEESLVVDVYPNPVASIGLDDGLGCAPLTVTFTNTSSGSQFQTWDFGDGSEPGFLSVPSHVFANTGLEPVLYDVTLVAESPQLCVDSTTVTITVLPTPVAGFTLAEEESCTFPVDIVTANTSTGSINHSWAINGETQTTAPAPVFSADAVGTYDVTLTASNSYGCTDVAEAPFTVHLAPIANLSANPRIGCNPLSVDFQDLSSYSQATSLFIAGIYDGPLPTDGLVIDQVGTFESYIVATSPEGCTDTLTLAEDFTVHPIPTAGFSYIPLTVSPENTSFQFNNESNTAFATNWTFGDGNGSFIPDPLHRYDEPGEYQVVLSVQNEFGCTDLAVDLLVIDDKISVFVPNAFTPASDGIGDGINDGFKPIIRGINLIQKYRFQVFDRWGTVIFETYDYDEFWKGDVYRGREDTFDYFAQNEVYNWKVTLTLPGEEADEVELGSNPFCNGPRQFCGHVSLIR